MSKIILSLFILVSLNSEAAGLRCFDLFAQNTVTTAKKSADFYAEAIDALNEKYNGFLFKEDLSAVLDPALESTPFFERTKARYQSYRLRKILKKLHAFDQYANDKASFSEDVFALEKLAVKLERLSFLNDESVTENMSWSEKKLYRQAQHSLLVGGLAHFLFAGEALPPPKRMKKILSLVLLPFKDVYFRWTFALAVMPKMQGAVIPYDVIEKVIIDGYDENHPLLQPYLRTTQGKAAFNVFSSAYNWILWGSLAFGTGQLAHTTYYDVYIPGVQKAEQMLAPLLQDAEKMAATDQAQKKYDRALEISLENFKIVYHRDATANEIQMIQHLVQANLESQKGTP